MCSWALLANARAGRLGRRERCGTESQPTPPQGQAALSLSSGRGASIEPAAFAQTAVIQEDEGRESVASTAQTNGIFGLLRVESPKLPQSATGFLAGLLFVPAFQCVQGQR